MTKTERLNLRVDAAMLEHIRRQLGPDETLADYIRKLIRADMAAKLAGRPAPPGPL